MGALSGATTTALPSHGATAYLLIPLNLNISVGHVSWIPSPLILIPLNLNTSVGHDFRIMPIKGLGAP